ncbi:MAG: SIS domain-containing protein [Pseudomonadota bacterium]|nr:SIS domain-containing protein [Pseudomonadota bacterium]MEC7305250.1 SIS domain-containing protein [Pseudomonadota bacterium]MEC7361861.1 SIS domain-containing protein [Pseudomonadota bacterium]MEC8110275.1 SIS domain-containing protein [Pseudomonadota bacterium]
MTDFTAKSIADILLTSAEVKRLAAEQCAGAAMQAAEMIAASLREGGKLMLCGNGGSAADSQHLAAEFVATLDHRRPRGGLSALALTTDSSFLTAYANDFGYEGIFARQVETLGRPGDVLIGISTSGNSANVLAACEAARNAGIGVVAMTGEGGGSLADHADVLLEVPSSVTMHIQESHIALGHVVTLAVERLLDL